MTAAATSPRMQLTAISTRAAGRPGLQRLRQQCHCSRYPELRRFGTNGSGSFYFDNDGFNQIYFVQGNEFVPGVGPLHNFARPSYYQRPDERYTIGAFAHYELTDRIEVYSELMFMDNRTVAQFAESGIFFNTMTFNCGNPLLSAQQRDTVGCAGAPDETDFRLDLRSTQRRRRTATGRLSAYHLPNPGRHPGGHQRNLAV
jgi:hypothetical protein